jgi:hypothetical protein
LKSLIHICFQRGKATINLLETFVNLLEFQRGGKPFDFSCD